MKMRVYDESNGKQVVLPPIIELKFRSTSVCAILACESCMLAQGKKQGAEVQKVKLVPKKEGALL